MLTNVHWATRRLNSSGTQVSLQFMCKARLRFETGTAAIKGRTVAAVETAFGAQPLVVTRPLSHENLGDRFSDEYTLGQRSLAGISQTRR